MSRDYEDFGAEANRWSGERNIKRYEPIKKNLDWQRQMRGAYPMGQAQQPVDPYAAAPYTNPFQGFAGHEMGHQLNSMMNNRASNPYNGAGKYSMSGDELYQPETKIPNSVSDQDRKRWTNAPMPEYGHEMGHQPNSVSDQDRKRWTNAPMSDSTQKSVDFADELDYAENVIHAPKKETSSIAKSADSGMPKYMEFYSKLASVTKSIGADDSTTSVKKYNIGDYGSLYTPGDAESNEPAGVYLTDGDLTNGGIHAVAKFLRAFQKHYNETGENILPEALLNKIDQRQKDLAGMQDRFDVGIDDSTETEMKSGDPENERYKQLYDDAFDAYRKDQTREYNDEAAGVPAKNPSFNDDADKRSSWEDKMRESYEMTANTRPYDKDKPWLALNDHYRAMKTREEADNMKREEDLRNLAESNPDAYYAMIKQLKAQQNRAATDRLIEDTGAALQGNARGGEESTQDYLNREAREMDAKEDDLGDDIGYTSGQFIDPDSDEPRYEPGYKTVSKNSSVRKSAPSGEDNSPIPDFNDIF